MRETDRRPRARDLGRHRPLPQHGLRHRVLREARSGRVGRRGDRVPHRPDRQPLRRGAHRARRAGHHPGAGRADPSAGDPAPDHHRASRRARAPPTSAPASTGWRVDPRGAASPSSSPTSSPSPASWERPLQRVAARHDTIAAEVLDPRELELPDVGVLSLVDPVTGEQRDVPTASAKLRARYAAAAAEQRRTIAERHPPQPEPTTCSCAPTATGCSTSCASSSAGPASASPGRNRAGGPPMNLAGARACRASGRRPGSGCSSLVAALAAAYVVLQTRRDTYAVKFTNLALLDSVAPKRPGLATPPAGGHRRAVSGLAGRWRSPSRPAARRCPVSGPRSSWPSTPRCR